MTFIVKLRVLYYSSTVATHRKVKIILEFKYNINAVDSTDAQTRIYIHQLKLTNNIWIEKM